MNRKYLLMMALSCGFMMSQAQTSLPDETAIRIKSEGFANSTIPAMSEFMTDDLGSRLAASQMKLRAEKMVVDYLQQMGLSNVHVEHAMDFAKGGWDNEKNYVAMTSPYYCSFSANPKAWSGSTNGLVKGECVLFKADKVEDFEQYRGKLAGKIVVMAPTQEYYISYEPLATRYTDEELEAMKTDPRPGTHNFYNFKIVSPTAPKQPRPKIDYRAMMEFNRSVMEFLNAEKPLAILNGSGTFNVPSGNSVNYKVGDPEPVTALVLPIEDHGRMARMLKKGEKVEMEMEIKNVFTDNQKINNVIAEIPGTDPKLKNEIVLIGAHFDSWHGSTGAADNASGCIVMMEAMRIIKALGIQPRRTIRLALWGGEEQGLYGSRGYADQYLYDSKEEKTKAGYDKFALYLNMDNGSGRFRGIYTQENDAAVPFMKAWGKSVEALGFTTISPRNTGSTDHVIFDQMGLPAYQFIQDPLEYDRTYHTIMDTYERLELDDLKVDAVITAVIALSAAMDNNRIPLKPGYPEIIPAKKASRGFMF